MKQIIWVVMALLLLGSVMAIETWGDLEYQVENYPGTFVFGALENSCLHATGLPTFATGTSFYWGYVSGGHFAAICQLNIFDGSHQTIYAFVYDARNRDALIYNDADPLLVELPDLF